MKRSRQTLVAVAMTHVWGCASETVPVDSPPPRAAIVAPKPIAPSSGCSDDEVRRPARQVLRGSASYYANSLAGNPTASGVPYDPGVDKHIIERRNGRVMGLSEEVENGRSQFKLL